MDNGEREEELSSLQAIYPELDIANNNTTARLDLAVAPASPLLVRFIPAPHLQHSASCSVTYASKATASRSGAHVEHDVHLSHLPPLCLIVTLPDGYPAEKPPLISLSTPHGWLPSGKLRDLEKEAAKLWEEYGQCQILFAYIDFLQQAAEGGFGLDQSSEGCLTLHAGALEQELLAFDNRVKRQTFETGTYDCGVCLEPKKGTVCHRLERCGHVFCKSCLQDFYNDAIKEGNLVAVRCLDPSCEKDQVKNGKKRKREGPRALHPRELLAMGVEETIVRRYVEMKRKKRLEADKNTVYCPRTWCQGPARSSQYPPIPKNLAEYPSSESSSDDSDADGALPTPPASPRLNAVRRETTARKAIPKPAPQPADPNDRLAVCEKCSLAFCRVCYMGWHGPFARCFPRDPTELSVDEKASYDYIRAHTSPCPTCFSPVQKTMGCNHMKCFQCNTHFCYLCGAWLDGQNPYQHFNKPGLGCYQRLWELEEGEDGGANGDGGERGEGGRGWMQVALEAAREAEEAEAEAAANEAQAQELAAGVERLQMEEFQPQLLAFRDDAVDNNIGNQQPQAPPARARRNPFPVPQAARGNNAAAVRAHERVRPVQQNRGAGVRRNPGNRGDDQRRIDELRRFVELAQRDEEDGWDSDDLGEEERFEIR
ncbi:RWD-domain-containing protein [Polychaeton citri CBS 116435]|uniref:RBR-type E3 ubiquitin transferase n=1 Tax=Polychaeton citri CBS 116435 TaxID=1314669 RepID=A0A9P4UN78_9PEZI|nr:RWD-domain-containing protein [Polychaeton citri CBS 116435]